MVSGVLAARHLLVWDRVALGCDYPTAHMIISESTPSSNRGQLVIGAFAFQAVGALVGTGVGWLVLQRHPALGAWHWMFATALIPGSSSRFGASTLPRAPSWLFVRGHQDRARARREAARQARAAVPERGHTRAAPASSSHEPEKMDFAALFKPAESARDDPGVRAVVPARPEHLRNRYLHADDLGRRVWRRHPITSAARATSSRRTYRR